MSSNRYNHRKANVKLKLLRPDGAPASNQPITVDQQRHQFIFGCGGFDSVELMGGNRDGTPLSPEREAFLRDKMDKVLALHNGITLPFYWGRYEPVEGEPDQRRTLAAAKWLNERGVTVKGHPLCWHTVCAPWLLKYGNKEIIEKQMARIKRDVSAFKGLIDTWDVINEVVIMPVFDKYDNAVTRICKELGQTGIVREVFAAAREANPGALLLLNDFDTSPGYERLIESCFEAGIPIDVIGIQSHQHQGYWGLEKLNDVLERFTRFGLPVHFTENTIISGELMPAHIVDLNDWQVPSWPTTRSGEDRQARQIVEIYETLYAHPNVEAVTHWDPEDGKWLGAPSGLLRKDNSLKPVYEALREKIKGEWWTSGVQLVTNDAGEAEFNGFKGDYAVQCGGEQASFILDGKNDTLTVTI
jgi:GH35 family endo-1,4-beta-xylanase